MREFEAKCKAIRTGDIDGFLDIATGCQMLVSFLPIIHFTAANVVFDVARQRCKQLSAVVDGLVSIRNARPPRPLFAVPNIYRGAKKSGHWPS